MNIYAIKARAKYGGGMAIVAAQDEEQAIALASTIEDTWRTDWANPVYIKALPVDYHGTEQILEHHEAGE